MTAPRIFSFAGNVRDPDSEVPGAERTGIVRATDADAVINTLAAWGFEVTAVSTLDEVEAAVGVMEQVLVGSDDLAPSDYLNCLGTAAPYLAAQTFSYVAQVADATPQYAGFAVASHARGLTDELALVQLVALTVADLEECRALLADMRAAAAGQGDCIDLIELSEAA